MRCKNISGSFYFLTLFYIEMIEIFFKKYNFFFKSIFYKIYFISKNVFNINYFNKNSYYIKKKKKIFFFK